MCTCHRQIRIELPTDLHELLRRQRRERGMTLTDIVVTACREWVRTELHDPTHETPAQEGADHV